MKALVSIIIPTYNRASFLPETLDSITSQTYSNWECIIVDDGSTDETEEILCSYCAKDKRFLYKKRPSHLPKGANACRNYGFELSKGDYINWFDSDDLMDPQKLELQLAKLTGSDQSLCVCQTQVFEESIENIQGFRHPKLISENFCEDYLMFKIMWLTQAPLWKRDFLLQMDYLFDEDLHAAQEWEFHLRALRMLDNYVVIKRPLVYLRIHEKSISNEKKEKVLWNYFLARYKIYKKFTGELSLKENAFLKRYLLEAYKNALRDHHLQLARKIWAKYIVKTANIALFSKLRLSMGYISYRLTNRGDIFISYIN